MSKRVCDGAGHYSACSQNLVWWLFWFLWDEEESYFTREAEIIINIVYDSSKYFTDRSKAVLLLWIFYVFVLSCVCYVFVRVCLYVLCGHLLGKNWPLDSRLWCLMWVCYFPIGILGQVWYLIVSIPDLCTLTYLDKDWFRIFTLKKGYLLN